LTLRLRPPTRRTLTLRGSIAAAPAAVVRRDSESSGYPALARSRARARFAAYRGTPEWPPEMSPTRQILDGPSHDDPVDAFLMRVIRQAASAALASLRFGARGATPFGVSTPQRAHLRRLRERPAGVSHEEFLDERYFRSLDGVRAFSILLVITWHTNRDLLAWLSGWEGPSIFFVLSGFVITTLCLREEARDGSVSLSAFYIRRACRILPLYFVVLAFYVVVDIGANWHGKRGALLDALPYYVSYMNDFAPSISHGGTPFWLSWTLGVEEKFYIFWPLLAFLLLSRNPRGRLLAASVLVLVMLPGRYLGGHHLAYSQIMVGCVLALCLHTRQGFERVQRLASRPWLVLVGLVAVHVVMYRESWIASVLFGPAVALALAALVTSRPPWARPLTSRLMVYIGKRSYAVYLVNLICLSGCVVAARAVAPSLAFNAEDQPIGGDAWISTVVLFFALTVASLIVAEVLHRTVEAPMIARARVWSRAIAGNDPVTPPRLTPEPELALAEAPQHDKGAAAAARAGAAGQRAAT
jgi:peptidoglycan/LPS O-acetylase OafA/YrhL